MGYLGSGQDWRIRNYLLAASDGGAVDPFFSDVVLLANGAGLLVDSSQYNWTLSSGGSIALNSTYPLNGFDTYLAPPSGNLFLSTLAHNSILSLIGSGELCMEAWIKVVSYSAFARTITRSPGYFLETGLSSGNVRWAFYIGGTLYSTGPIFGALNTGDFRHVTLIRDNTTDPNWTRLHYGYQGAIIGTSTANIPKGNPLTTTSAFEFLGGDAFAPTIAFGGYRLTRNTRRYLVNAEGEPLNGYTPDPYPFLLG